MYIRNTYTYIFFQRGLTTWNSVRARFRYDILHFLNYFGCTYNVNKHSRYKINTNCTTHAGVVYGNTSTYADVT